MAQDKITMTVGLGGQLSNQELGVAIREANTMFHGQTPNSAAETMWFNHLSMLLRVQRARAAACTIGYNDEIDPRDADTQKTE